MDLKKIYADGIRCESTCGISIPAVYGKITTSVEARRVMVVLEARSWIGTPYHVRGRVKGAGCDCGSFLMSVATNCELVEDEDLEVYSLDCWAHWSEEKYLRHVMRHAYKLSEKVAYRSDKILPGCLVLTRAAGCQWYNHGGIVTKWPMIIHALNPAVEEVDATKHFLWSFREIAVFDFKKVVEA